MRSALIVAHALVIAGALLGRARRRRVRFSLEERLRFETLVSELSATLIPEDAR